MTDRFKSIVTNYAHLFTFLPPIGLFSSRIFISGPFSDLKKPKRVHERLLCLKIYKGQEII